MLAETRVAEQDLERALRHLEQASTLFRLEEPHNAAWRAHTLRRRAAVLAASREPGAADTLRREAERIDPGGRLDAAPVAVIRSEP